jgi:ABC-2 type transport system permease protein
MLRRDPAPWTVLLVMPLALTAFVRPIYRVLLRAEGRSDASGAEQAIPGMATMFAFYIVVSIGIVFFREQGWRTWARLVAGSARRDEIVIGKLLPPMLVGVIQLVVLFGAGWVVFDLRFDGSHLGLVMVGGALVVCFAAVATLVVAISRTVLQVNAFANVGALVLAGLGGALAPVNSLPGWARDVAPATPHYWAMRGFRSFTLDHAAFGAFVAPTAVLLGLAAAVATAAAVQFRSGRWERRALA